MSWCLCKFFEELVLFQGMRMEFRDKIMLRSSQEVNSRVEFQEFNIWYKILIALSPVNR